MTGQGASRSGRRRSIATLQRQDVAAHEPTSNHNNSPNAAQRRSLARPLRCARPW